jgi:hypothetical protein
MLKTSLRTLPLLLSVALLCSCKNEGSGQENTMALDNAQEVTSLNDNIKDVDIVRLKGDQISQAGGCGFTKVLSIPDGYVVLAVEAYKYDKDGSFIGEIDTGILGNTSDAVIPVTENTVALYFANPPEADLTNLDKEFNCLKIIGEDGKVVSEAAPRTDFNIVMGFTPATSKVQGRPDIGAGKNFYSNIREHGSL